MLATREKIGRPWSTYLIHKAGTGLWTIAFRHSRLSSGSVAETEKPFVTTGNHGINCIRLNTRTIIPPMRPEIKWLFTLPTNVQKNDLVFKNDYGSYYGSYQECW